MPDGWRERFERMERERLSPNGAKAAESRGRTQDEPEDPFRTCYMRDRDRILHSKAFRRLRGKTQVVIDPVQDHVRTRLTHTLEVAQISRTVARALGMNEDLTEAIALGHDLGHPPFGHIGEECLDRSIRQAKARGIEGLPEGFRHDLQSLRIVEVVEPLNLSIEVLEGIGGHSKGRADLTESISGTTLEAQIVRVCDRIAYLNHDLDDALRLGILDRPPAAFLELGDRQGRRVGAMVDDLIRTSFDGRTIRFSNEMLRRTNEIKEWMFERVYLRPATRDDGLALADRVVPELLDWALERFDSPAEAVDHVAGMTDRFATNEWHRLFGGDGPNSVQTQPDRM